MNDRECALPVLLVVGLSLIIGLLVYWQYQYDEWVHTNCQATEEIRTVEDYPTYVDVSGGSGIMIPVGGGSHQERAWSCPATGGRAARTAWLED
jgi:hypothetical protein